MISIEVPLHNEHDNRTRVFTLICGAKWGIGVSRHLLAYSPRRPHPLCLWATSLTRETFSSHNACSTLCLNTDVG